jgi:REP element-mobilizing transposase RayT
LNQHNHRILALHTCINHIPGVIDILPNVTKYSIIAYIPSFALDKTNNKLKLNSRNTKQHENEETNETFKDRNNYFSIS